MEKVISDIQKENKSMSLNNDLVCWPCTVMDDHKEAVHEFCYGSPCECECQDEFGEQH